MSLERRRHIPVALAIVAAAVLLTGILSRPATRENTTGEMTISAVDLQGLRKIAESNSLSALRARVNGVAERAAPALVWSEQWRRAGVVWRRGEALVARSRLAHGRTESLRVSGAIQSTTPLRWAPGLPFAKVGIGKAEPARQGDASGLPAGTLVVAVGLRDTQRLLLPATLSGVVRGDCQGWNVDEIRLNLFLPDEFVGGGIFNLDGELIGIITDCGQDAVAVSLGSVDRILSQLDGPDGQWLIAYGAALSDLSDDLRSHFGVAKGVIVDSVWDRWPAAMAGLLPGDIITEVDDRPVATLGDLVSTGLSSKDAIRVVVRRGLRPRVIDLRRAESTSSGVVVHSLTGQLILETVPHGSHAYAAGFRSGDTLVGAIGLRGRPVAIRSFEKSELVIPVYVIARRAGRMLGGFIHE